MLTCSCSPRALCLGWHIVGFYQLYWVSTSFWSSKSASRGFVKGQWFIHFVPLIWAKRWGINLKAIQCFGRVSAPFPRSFLSSCQITAGLHLLNPPPWIFTSLAALSQVLFSPCEFSRIGMWRDVPAATAGRFMKTALCSTYTCNELNPPGSFIHSLFQNLSEPLNQITAFTQLRITPDGVSVWHSVILWRGKRKEETKRKFFISEVIHPFPSSAELCAGCDGCCFFKLWSILFCVLLQRQGQKYLAFLMATIEF